MRSFSFLLTAAILTGVCTSPLLAQTIGQPRSERAGMTAQTYDYTDYGRLPTPPGGVAGNAPFNNQIRKHTAPLSANGGK